MLEPLAQAMAALTDETRETLAMIEQRSREQGEAMKAEIGAAAKVLSQASSSASQAARTMLDASGRTETRHYVLVALTALMTAMLAHSGSGWRRPTVQNHLDAKALAEYLRPEIAAAKPSNGK